MTRAYLGRRAYSKVHQWLHRDAPWFSPEAVRFLDRVLDRTWVGLEWGSGRSTTWLARRVCRVTSVEHDPVWYRRVEERAANLSNVDLRYIPLDHPEHETGAPRYESMPRYVRVADEFAGESLDFVIVDGAYRQPCVAAALPKLRPGGMLVIDNTDWLPIAAWGVPPVWAVCHQSRNLITQTTVWRRPRPDGG